MQGETMQARKLEFSNDVIRLVHDLCKLVFNSTTDHDVEKIFGITHEQLEKIIKNIVDAMPACIFEHPQKLNEIKNIFAKEFIFFQVQEKMNDPHYPDDLSDFIKIFSRDIQKKFNCASDRE